MTNPSNPTMPSTPDFLSWQEVEKLVDYHLASVARPVRRASDDHTRRHRARRPDRRGA